MTDLTSIMRAGLSGLTASQAGLSVASQNISNANTPGYVRTEVTFSPRSQLGYGAGVEVSGIQRAADRFLATAAYLANASKGAAGVRSDLLARAQSSFGDPTSDTSVFATLDRFWSALTTLGVDPSSALRRDDAVSSLQSAYTEIQAIAGSVQDLIGEADQRIGDNVGEAQSLLDRIASLNDEIRLTKRSGADASAAENAQSALVDKLSEFVDVRTSPVAEGGITVRTGGGALLVGARASQIDYTANTAPYATHGVVTLNPDLGTQANLEPFLQGGSIQGLIQARDKDLASLSEALGGFAAALGDALNEVHNENASSPPVSNMTGRQTGLLGSDALNFTGIAVVGITDSSGVLAQRLTVDFDNGVITGEAPAGNFAFGNTIDSFTQALNNALGAATPSGSASFADGVMQLSVGNNGGIVIQQDSIDPAVTGDTATPSDRAGRGFSHFFGLNDLVTRPTPLFFETGLDGSDAHGLTAGGSVSFRVRDAAGRFVTTRTVSISGALTNAGSTWDDVLGELNANGTGLGGYGSFAFNATTGRVELTPGSGFQIDLTSDSTERGTTGVSFSALFGLSQLATAGRASEANVVQDVADDPSRLAVARPDLHAAIGDQLVEAGDNRGSSALADARDASRSFDAAGALTRQTTSLAIYGARLAGEAGRMANDAQRLSQGAEAVATAATDRRAQVEGVSLDDELLRMTTYQNSYAAAARVIQAVTEMFDILLNVGR